MASEFLLDHWQKLILCLAVLLIVVSSNVGAYQLLGPRIWSPAGKTILGLVYTGMFAAFGAGLARWGARRAGRIMLLTTLIVIPANFMLAGEMRLLTRPTTTGLALLAIETAALLALARGVTTALGVDKGAWPLAIALLGLSAFNAAAAPGDTWSQPGQLALYFAPAIVFLLAIVWLTARFDFTACEDPAEVGYASIGLLTFAFLAGVARTGILALKLPPTLFAAPVMVAGLGAVRVGKRLQVFDPDPRRATWTRLGGVALSGLAFALALARPPGMSALLSGNTLAVAVMGLGLYGALLWTERHPAYLYMGFAALVAAYFGAFYFVVDLIRAFEESVRRGLGYQTPLPIQFKAINGLVFNALLALLAVAFKRRWNDPNLARHCHWIGLPLSVACCVFSAFEPKAGTICLAGYSVLYTLAVVVFREPRLTYLSGAALAGAAYLGSTLVPGMTLAERALIAATIGVVEWCMGALLRRGGVERSFREPLGHVALAMGALGMALAAGSALPPGGFTPTAGLAFLLAALLAILVNGESPALALGYLAAFAASLGHGFLVLSTDGPLAAGLDMTQQAVAAGAAAVVLALVGTQLQALIARGGRPAVDPLASYPMPTAHMGLAHVVIAVGQCILRFFQAADWRALSPREHATIAAALVLGALALAILSARYPQRVVAWLAWTLGLGAWFALARAGVPGRLASLTDHAALATGYAVALLTSAEVVRNWLGDWRARPAGSRLGIFLGVVPDFAVVVALVSTISAVGEFDWGWNATSTFAMSSLAILWGARDRRLDRLIDVGLNLGVLAVLRATANVVVSRGAPNSQAAWMSLAAAGAMFTLDLFGTVARRLAGGTRYAEGADRTSRFTGWVVLALGVVGAIFHPRGYVVAAPSAALSGVGLMLLTRRVPLPLLTYRAVFALVVGVYIVVFSVGKGSPETAHVPGLIGIVLGLSLQAATLLGRRWKTDARESLYWTPVVHSAIALNLLGGTASYWSPTAMLLSGLAFLVLVKTGPGRDWLYTTVGACCVALYFGVLQYRPPSELVTAAMVVAYQLWLLGLFVRRAEGVLVRLLRLPGRGYAHPLFHAALVAAGVAAALRGGEVLQGTSNWTDSAGLTYNLAGFSLLMIQAYPTLIWVHGAVALATLGSAMVARPHMPDLAWYLPLVLLLASIWEGVGRLWRRHEATITRLARIVPGPYPRVPLQWSLAMARLGGLTAAAWVVTGVVATLTWGFVPVTGAPDWNAVAAALGMGAAWIVAWSIGRRLEVLVSRLFVVVVLTTWWLLVPGSPVTARLGIMGADWLALVTSALGLLAVGWVTERERQRGSSPDASDTPGWGESHGFLIRAGAFLAVLGVVMTLGEVRPQYVAALLASALGLGLLAVTRTRIWAAYASGIVACASGLMAALDLAREQAILGGPERVVLASGGLLAGVAALAVAAGWLRRRDRARFAEGDPTDLPARCVAFAWEHVVLLGSAFCGAGIVATLGLPRHPDDRAALVGVGVLAGLAAVVVLLLRRWRLPWLVYPAQAAVLGAYLYYRWAFPLPRATDALILILFGYLDFGLAEAMHRAGFPSYARATRRFALVVPLLPVAFSMVQAPLDATSLFVLFTAATFYGVACYRVQSRPLGYAAAVLYNGFLWVLWSRVGWTLADRPQFFLVPVGLSAILFAEVNRKELGKTALQGIRAVGLMVIYVSLAVPVWQFQSLGAWATLLFVSLAGVFAGIALRVQTFLWLGLAGFVLDVVYQLGHVGMENTLAKWAIMLVLGILLILFVALNEKKGIVRSMMSFYDEARRWD